VNPPDILEPAATNAQQSRFSAPDGYFRKLPLKNGSAETL
jgi:hypothetical protein